MAERKPAGHVIVNGEHVIANTYIGPTNPEKHSRGVRDIERLFVKDLGKSFDMLLTDSLLRAESERRCGITLLDIGSGRAELFRNFLESPGINGLTRAFLYTHPGFEVNLIGFSDSPIPEMHLQNFDLPVEEERLSDLQKKVNQQIRARNFAYTLTASQTLERFLKHVGICEIDLILATNSLRYLSPQVFKEVVQTGVDHLKSGGMFIASRPAWNLPWAIGPNNDGFNTVASSSSQTGEFISVMNSYAGHNDSSLSIYEKSAEIIAQQDPVRYKTLIEKGWEFYKKLGVLTDEQTEKAKRQADKEFNPSDDNQMLWWEKVARLTLTSAFKRFVRGKREESMLRKKIIIGNIPRVKLEWFNKKDPKGGGFILTKQ